MSYSLQYATRTIIALLRRDLKVLSQKLLGTLIDGAILVTTEIMLYAHFLPLMGMPAVNIAPLYIGSVIFILFFLGENTALKQIFDIHNDRFIDYQITLPLGYRALFTYHVISFMIEAFLISIPLFVVGIIMLGQKISLVHAQWPLFIIIYFLSILLFALFFLVTSVIVKLEWFMDNIWPRVLSPLYAFGCTVFIWHDVYDFSKPLAYACLTNPLTYVSEGLRASLLGGNQFINAWICMVMIMVSIALNIWLLAYGIKKRLDPV